MKMKLVRVRSLENEKRSKLKLNRNKSQEHEYVKEIISDNRKWEKSAAKSIEKAILGKNLLKRNGFLKNEDSNNQSMGFDFFEVFDTNMIANEILSKKDYKRKIQFLDYIIKTRETRLDEIELYQIIKNERIIRKFLNNIKIGLINKRRLNSHRSTVRKTARLELTDPEEIVRKAKDIFIKKHPEKLLFLDNNCKKMIKKH